MLLIQIRLFEVKIDVSFLINDREERIAAALCYANAFCFFIVFQHRQKRVINNSLSVNQY